MRILLAMDGSESSVQARDLVAALPWPGDTAITLLTANELPLTWVSGAAVTGGDWMEKAEAGLRRQLAEDLEHLAQPLEGRGWTIESRVVDGRPATVILHVAGEIGADLVVLGSRGLGTITSMLLGSVSAEVADNAVCPVLVVRHDHVTRLLVATDGSDGVAAIPQLLGEWGVFRGMPATAASVAPVDSPTFELLVRLYTLGNEPLEDQRRQQLDAARTHAEDMAGSLAGIGIEADAVVSAGDAADELVKLARERQVDLIVTGSRRLHGLEGLALGSVARNVLMHADASVLVTSRPGSTKPS